MHIEPIDPRSQGSAPVVLVYPYGIVVDREGRRFMDEGAAWCTRPGKLSPGISISRDRARSPMRSSTAGCSILKAISARSGRRCRPIDRRRWKTLRRRSEFPPEKLKETVEAFNAAATGDIAQFDATRCDGLATSGGSEPAEIELGARRSTRRPFSPNPWSAASPIHLADSPPTKRRRCWARRGRYRVFTRRAKPPGISTAPRRTP